MAAPYSIQNTYIVVLGSRLAADVFLELGGAELTLGRDPKNSMLTGIVGRENAYLLAQELPAKHRVPLANIWLAQYLHAKGRSVSDICRTLRVTDGTARHYIGAAPICVQNEYRDKLQIRQLDLFIDL